MIFLTPPPADEVTQGDILTGCPIYRHNDGGPPTLLTVTVVVLTQACDLAQGKAKRVLVAAVYPADQMVAQGDVKAAAVRDQVRRGQVFGLYFLPSAPGPIPLPEVVVDLRDVHTVPRATIDRLVADGKRACRLATPFREHLAQHFAVTYMRIALPSPYPTAP